MNYVLSTYSISLGGWVEAKRLYFSYRYTMFSRLFRATQSIAGGAIILAIFSLVSRLIGLYRDRLLASTFGAGSVLDAYYAAFRLPDFMFNVIVLGALSAGFIPIFSELYEKQRERSWRFAQAMLLIISGGLLVASVVLYIVMPQLIPLITPGFDNETMQLTIQMSRVMLFSPFFLGVSGVFGGILQSFKRFFAYSLAPVFYNAGIIVGILVFSKSLGPIGLAWGVALGSVLHVGLQAVVSVQAGWHWHWLKPWREAGMKDIAALMGPRTLSIVLTEATAFIVVSMASGLSEGSLSLFNFAHNLAHVPIGLFGISFAVAAFPPLSEYIAQGRHKKFRRTLHETLSSLLFFLVPTVVTIALLNRELVQILLGTGKFTSSSVSNTGMILLFMVGHMTAQSILPTYTRAYYAQKNTWYPLLAAAFGVAFNAALAYGLSRSYGVVGLALSLSVASTAQMLALIFGPHIKVDYVARRHVYATMGKTMLAGTCMFIVMALTHHAANYWLDQTTTFETFALFVIQVSLSGIAYLLVLRGCNSDEYKNYQVLMQRQVRSLFASVPRIAKAVEEVEK